MNRVGSLTKITRIFSNLEQQIQREPTHQEVADILNITVEEVTSSVVSGHRHASLDAPLDQESDGRLIDVFIDQNEATPDAHLLIDSLKSEIKSALNTLTPRESEVLSCYFGLNGNAPMNLDEIGTKFQLTRERVRQIKEKATRRLKHISRSKTLRTYLGT
jgi:RNA polymerase primary sigma factor